MSDIILVHGPMHNDHGDLMNRLSELVALPRPLPPCFLPSSPPLNPFLTTSRNRCIRPIFHTHTKGVRMSDKSSTKPRTATNMPSTFLYFCYGSNMLRSKLSTRGPPSTPPISFTDVFKARLSDWQLCFDLCGAPPMEPAMASIRPKKGDHVHGMVYRITSTRSWEKLLTSEGVTEPQGPYDSYHVVTLPVQCFVDEKYVEMSVMTFVANPRYKLRTWMQPLVRPSRRYLNILIDGATQEGLPKDYVETLENISVAKQWNPSPLMYIMMLSIPLVFLSRRRSTRLLTFPLTDFGMMLYARHEGMLEQPDASSFSTEFGVIFCKIALFLLYSLYAVPSALVMASSPMGRAMALMILKKQLQSKVKEPVESVTK